LTLNGPGESHRQQDQLGLDLEFAPWYRRVLTAPAREHLSLQPHGVQPLDSSVLAGESGRGDAPFSFRTFFVRVTGAQLHRPQRPRCTRRATCGRLRQQLELSDTARSLTNAGSGTIGARVTAADDHDAPIARVLDRFEKGI